ncbi:MAG: hypothetical protein ABIR17_09360 [Pseudolysinimonas sp.]|uniref:hypothetical protein n=1 Tax=Pseudolysinimonas sp. TaxID=2680009 RepID=UPI003267516C
MTTPAASSVADVLGGSWRISALLWVLITGTDLALLLLDPAGGIPRSGAWLTWALLVVAAGAALFPRRDPLRAGWSALAAGLAVVAAAAVFWDPPSEESGYSPWYLRAAATVLIVIVLRRRPAVGWVGMALLTAVVLTWAAVSGEDVAHWIGVIARPLATLVAVQVAAIGLSLAARTVAAYQAEQRQRVRSEVLRSAAIRERRTELAAIRSLSTSVLERIAADEDDPAVRKEAILVEGALRDVLRGRRLAREPLTTEARAARQRGVEVVLLDDLGDDLRDEQPGNALASDALVWAADLVRRAAGATATVRLSRRRGRPYVTVLAGDDDIASREF